jgi:hypothetical protein
VVSSRVVNRPASSRAVNNKAAGSKAVARRAIREAELRMLTTVEAEVRCSRETASWQASSAND